MINVAFHRTGNGRGSNATPNMASLAFMRWLAADYQAQEAHYIALRKWYAGDHNVPLTDRQREFIGRDSEFDWSVNYLPVSVELCAERLIVEGFDGPKGIGGKDGLLMKWWRQNRMDATQGSVHRADEVDGDTYIIVDPPTEDAPYPQFSHNTAYDGVEGVKVHYLSNLKREMTMASKVWSESRFNERGQVQTVQRLNLYLPDVIEKYENTGKGWTPLVSDGEAWPIPWPVGRIPVVHFRWKDDGGNWGESEIEKAIPIQEVINKAVMDEMAAADVAGFQVVTLTGATVGDVDVTPGAVLQTDKTDANWGVIPPADLSQLRARIDDYIARMAQIQHIPPVYFRVTSAISSASTQEADDSQIVAKVAGQSGPVGNAWEDVMRLALMVNAAFNNGPKINDDVNIEVKWKDFERVDRLALEERRANILEKLVNAGASLPGALALPSLGYTEEEQAAMSQTDVVTGIAQ